MRTLIGQRIGRLILAIWSILTVAFLTIYALPGDPARLVLGQHASAEAVERFRSDAGLDRSLAVRYVVFLGRTARLEFGDSLVERRAVRALISERAEQTAVLAAFALLLVGLFSFALPLIWATMSPSGEARWMSKAWGMVAAVPPYVLAVLLLLLFAGILRWIPILFDANRFVSWILPALVLATYPIAIVLKLFQQQIDKAEAAAYVQRALAYGYSRRRVLWTELVPNVLTPALASLANSLAFFVTGTFFVEVVFGMTGLGSLTYEALRNKDVPLLLGLCVAFTVTITLISGLLDLLLTLSSAPLRARRA